MPPLDRILGKRRSEMRKCDGHVTSCNTSDKEALIRFGWKGETAEYIGLRLVYGVGGRIVVRLCNSREHSALRHRQDLLVGEECDADVHKMLEILEQANSAAWPDLHSQR
jgi:hypothetical protein